MDTTMSSDPDSEIPPVTRVEVITSVQWRRRWTTAEKIRLVEEAMQPGMSVSCVARKAGVSPSLLFSWKRRMLEGSFEAVRADEEVVGSSRVKEPEKRLRELERLLGRKTMEAEILREALDAARAKKSGSRPHLRPISPAQIRLKLRFFEVSSCPVKRGAHHRAGALMIRNSLS